MTQFEICLPKLLSFFILDPEYLKWEYFYRFPAGAAGCSRLAWYLHRTDNVNITRCYCDHPTTAPGGRKKRHNRNIKMHPSLRRGKWEAILTPVTPDCPAPGLVQCCRHCSPAASLWISINARLRSQNQQRVSESAGQPFTARASCEALRYPGFSNKSIWCFSFAACILTVCRYCAMPGEAGGRRGLERAGEETTAPPPLWV